MTMWLAHKAQRGFLTAFVFVLMWSSSTASGSALAGPSRSERIISLSPGTTEWVAALGRLGDLAGRTESCDVPPEVRTLPSVGAFLEPNLARVVALRPTLVLVTADFNPRRIAELGRQVPEIFRLDTGRLDAWMASVRQLAHRLGSQGRAESIFGPMLQAVGGEAPTARPLRYIGFVDLRSRYVMTAATLQGDIFESLGMRNLVDLAQPFPQVSETYLKGLSPEVVVLFANADAARPGRGPMDEAFAGALVPTPAEVQAITDLWPRSAPRLIKLDGDVFLRPGPRIVQLGWHHVRERIKGIRAQEPK